MVKSGLNRPKPKNTVAVQNMFSYSDHRCECFMQEPEPSPTEHVIIPTKYKNIKLTNIQADIHSNPDSPLDVTTSVLFTSFNFPSPIAPIASPVSPHRRPHTQFIQDNFYINEIEEGERMLDEYAERITDQTENGIESSDEIINDNNKRVTLQNHKEGSESHRHKNNV